MIKVNLVGSLNVGELVVLLERNGVRLDGFPLGASIVFILPVPKLCLNI